MYAKERTDLLNNNIGFKKCWSMKTHTHTGTRTDTHRNTQTQTRQYERLLRFVKTLVQVIRTNPCLKKVGLSMNKIGKDGCLALAEAARLTPCIKQIQILPGASAPVFLCVCFSVCVSMGGWVGVGVRVCVCLSVGGGGGGGVRMCVELSVCGLWTYMWVCVRAYAHVYAGGCSCERVCMSGCRCMSM